jgi:hypothetical protein
MYLCLGHCRWKLWELLVTLIFRKNCPIYIMRMMGISNKYFVEPWSQQLKG